MTKMTKTWANLLPCLHLFDLVPPHLPYPLSFPLPIPYKNSKSYDFIDS